MDSVLWSVRFGVEMEICKLTITGGKKEQVVVGKCSCGGFIKYINTSGKGSIVGSSKETIKWLFKKHKGIK